jgi:3-hydroxyisobutyrate dehydrogenase-like beta-hydroxyacid dehydrogenase
MQRAEIGVLFPGELGEALALALSRDGATVATCVAGRSPETIERARRSGIRCEPSLEALIKRVGVVLSIVPAGAAMDVAEAFAAQARHLKRPPIFADLNAISPSDAQAMNEMIQQAGAEFVDGGIVGTAARVDRVRLYCAGRGAGDLIGALGGAIQTVHLSDRIGDASAFKLLFSGVNKGIVALLSEMLGCAQRLGWADELIRCYEEALPPGAATLFSELAGSFPLHAKRRAAEMRSLEDFLRSHKSPARMAGAARDVLGELTDRIRERRAVSLSTFATLAMLAAGT